MPIVETQACQCAQCGYIWLPRDGGKIHFQPLWCARCKSAKWNAGAAASSSEPIVMKPGTRTDELPREVVEPKVKPKVERKVARPKVEKRPLGKIPKCPHGFFVYEGATQCKVCRENA